MTPEAETQKTRMGCNTSKCDCNFENETVSALKAHLERQYGPLGLHYDSIWKVTRIILVIEALLWAGFKGLRWYRRRRAQKKAFKGRAAWDSWLAQTQGHGMPANTAALLGPQAAFIPGPPPAPSAPPLPLSNSPPNYNPNFDPHPLLLQLAAHYRGLPQASQGRGGTEQERQDAEEELRTIMSQNTNQKRKDESDK